MQDLIQFAAELQCKIEGLVEYKAELEDAQPTDGTETYTPEVAAEVVAQVAGAIDQLFEAHTLLMSHRRPVV